MSTYTITLRELIKRGYSPFDDSWTTFIPEHKPVLCQKIIDHYYFYEIGSETPDRFKFYINEHLRLIMPYYNQLYSSELLKLEPLFDKYEDESGMIGKGKSRNRGTTNRTDVNRLREMAESIKKLIEAEVNLTGNQNTVGNETWKEDKTIHTTEITDQNTSEDTTQKIVTSESEDETRKEVMNDVIDGTSNTKGTSNTDTTKDSNGTSNTTTSNTRRYADTPQAEVSSSDMTIERTYLTNYTRDNGTSNTTTTDHETGNSNTTTNTDETAHSQEDRTTDTTIGITKSSTEDLTKGVTGTNDINKTIDTTDNTTGSRDTTSKLDKTEDTTSKSKEDDFKSGSESDKQSQLGVENEEVKEAENQTSKVIRKGFTVSQAELLKAYRSTFLNIDMMIVRDLVTNFMGVF